ncbi:DUF4238 domain-containing protein [Hymenobacter sp. CRA2]|uniref:DUF4238 domain-containing protein n=1 Tax=Hymenobacter sp. CRA2 TaxID=1955620 RepID=UPI00098EAC72|nr:DUF4238 domain-containing protein [Hymenobacter sp. CRA2]OON67912.1 hypothetical protein B0919_14665 [Hymenobacter sp. CRA2]
MSTPLNHHYVSQCQIRNFFNQSEKKIYLYDKIRNNFFNKTTTKSVFSERELNTVYENGQLNHDIIEKDLKDYFEDSFVKNTKIILDYAETQIAVKDELINALIDITKLGIIGDMRNPVSKRQLDDAIYKPFEELRQYAAPNLKEQIDQALEDRKKTKYSNKLQYSKIAEDVIEKMFPLVSVIFYITTEDDYFVLSDCSSIVSRAKINKYFNPDIQEIANVGTPLTSKLLVQTMSSKLGRKEGGIYYLGDNHKSMINDINMMTLASSKKMVACESEAYLKSFIERVWEFKAVY